MAEMKIDIAHLDGTNIAFGERSHAGDIHHDDSGLGDAPSRRPGDKLRQVFVIHGRDQQMREAVFALIRSLGLVPLEWEHLVRETGSGAPSLHKVVSDAPKLAQAVVALLTPDDVVTLHSSLHAPEDSAEERGPACQARPNVFIEVGMALALLPERTIILRAGAMRWPADLEGLNYIRITESADWCNKLAERLLTAGCPVNRTGADWQRTDRFEKLDAHKRRPDSAFTS